MIYRRFQLENIKIFWLLFLLANAFNPFVGKHHLIIIKNLPF